MAACAYPRLITACHVLRQHSSQAIPCMVYSPLSLGGLAISNGKLSASLPWHVHYRPIKLLFWESLIYLFLGPVSVLDAFSPYRVQRGYPACLIRQLVD